MSNTFALRPARTIRPAAAPAPAPKPAPEPTGADWQTIDITSLPEDIAEHYYAYRQALDHANKLRQVFEDEANEAFDVGSTNKLAFGYKFGKLSGAIVPKSRPSSGRSAINLTSLAKPR